MEATQDKPKRVRTVVYLDPAVRRRLKIEGAETDRAGGSIVEEALRQYFDDESPRTLSHSA